MQFSFVSRYSLQLAAFGMTALLLSGCDDSSKSSDNSLPAAGEIKASPANSSINVALVSSIKLRFGTPVNLQGHSTEITVSLGGEPVEGNVIYSANTQQLTFQPVEALKPNAMYTVSVAEVVDSLGNVMPQYDWSFSTIDNVGPTPQWVIDACMTAEDIAMLADINRQREVGAQCGDQLMAPAASLAWHCDLAFLAQEHAADLAHMGVLGTTGSNGKSTFERVTDAGIIWRGIAENTLAAKADDSVLDQVLDSDEQCGNILDSRLTHIGLAAAPSSDAEQHNIWVQLLIQQ